MANVIEIAKAQISAYNDKNWSKVKDVLAADAVYDEKGMQRRIQGADALCAGRNPKARTISIAATTKLPNR